MKIPFGLLFLLTFSAFKLVSQNNPELVLNQKISMEVADESVSAVLKQIGKQIHLNFSYDSRIIDGKRRVTASFKNKTVSEIIFLLFDNKVKCKLKGNYIILYQNTTVSSRVPSKSGRTTIKKEERTMKKNSINDTIPSLNKLPDSTSQAVQHFNNPSIPTASESNSNTHRDSIESVPFPLWLINNDSIILLLEDTDTVVPPR